MVTRARIDRRPLHADRRARFCDHHSGATSRRMAGRWRLGVARGVVRVRSGREGQGDCDDQSGSETHHVVLFVFAPTSQRNPTASRAFPASSGQPSRDVISWSNAGWILGSGLVHRGVVAMACGSAAAAVAVEATAQSGASPRSCTPGGTIAIDPDGGRVIGVWRDPATGALHAAVAAPHDPRVADRVVLCVQPRIHRDAASPRNDAKCARRRTANGDVLVSWRTGRADDSNCRAPDRCTSGDSRSAPLRSCRLRVRHTRPTNKCWDRSTIRRLRGSPGSCCSSTPRAVANRPRSH